MQQNFQWSLKMQCATTVYANHSLDARWSENVKCELWVKLAPRNQFMPSSKMFLLTVPKRYFFCGSFVFFVSCVSYAFASVHCCLVVTCWVRADLLALVGDVYFIFFVTFPCGILGQVWYLIVSFPDLCCISYFDTWFSKTVKCLHRRLHDVIHLNNYYKLLQLE